MLCPPLKGCKKGSMLPLRHIQKRKKTGLAGGFEVDTLLTPTQTTNAGKSPDHTRVRSRKAASHGHTGRRESAREVEPVTFNQGVAGLSPR